MSSETPAASVTPSTPSDLAASTVTSTPKVKKPRTSKQLEQLAQARAKRGKKTKGTGGGGGSIVTKSDSADDFVKRLERADPEVSENVPKGKKRKRESDARSLSFGGTKDLFTGALVVGGLGIAAYQLKKKGLLSNSAGPTSQAPPMTNSTPTAPSSGPPTSFNASNLFS